jgi:hypothetical protein
MMLPIFLLLCAFMCVITLFGFDLAVRGISGRYWSRQFWMRADERLQAVFSLRSRSATAPASSWPASVWLAVSVVLVAVGLGNRRDPRSWDLAFYWFGGFLQLLAHELGHLAAVLAAGYAPGILAAGPLAIRFRDGRPALGLNPSWSTLLYGHVTFVRVRPTRAKGVVIAASGPLASLIVLAILLLAPPVSGPFLALFLRNTGIVTGIILFMNLLPLPRASHGLATDGRQIVDLLRRRI